MCDQWGEKFDWMVVWKSEWEKVRVLVGMNEYIHNPLRMKRQATSYLDTHHKHSKA